MECGYCYEKGIPEGRIPLSNIYKSMDALISQMDSHDRELKIEFLGKEPLLTWDLIRNAMDYMKETYPDYIVEYLITTNGTIINDQIIEMFEDESFRKIIISIDGPEAVFNKNRLFKDGTSAFPKILNTVQQLVSNDLIRNKLIAHITLNEKNIRFLHTSTKYLYSLGFELITIGFVNRSLHSQHGVFIIETLEKQLNRILKDKTLHHKELGSFFEEHRKTRQISLKGKETSLLDQYVDLKDSDMSDMERAKEKVLSNFYYTWRNYNG